MARAARGRQEAAQAAVVQVATTEADKVAVAARVVPVGPTAEARARGEARNPRNRCRRRTCGTGHARRMWGKRGQVHQVRHYIHHRNCTSPTDDDPRGSSTRWCRASALLVAVLEVQEVVLAAATKEAAREGREATVALKGVGVAPTALAPLTHRTSARSDCSRRGYCRMR